MSYNYRKKSKTMKNKSKSMSKIKKSKHTKKNVSYLKKLKLEEELSRSIIEEAASKTPVVAMSHGAKLLTKSKKQLRKGNVGNAMASLLTAVAVLSATGPFSQHPNVKKQRMTREYEGRWTGDPDELMKWHMDEQFKPSLRKTTRKKERNLKKKQNKTEKKQSKTLKKKSKTLKKQSKTKKNI